MWDSLLSIYTKFKDIVYSKNELISASIGGFLIYSAVINSGVTEIMSTLVMKSAEFVNGYSINLTAESNMSKVIIAGLSPSAIMVSQRSREKMGIRKERSRWEIIEDMLIVLMSEEKSKKTRIMQRAYLDWRNFQRYFDFLQEEGFMVKCNNLGDEGYYELTERGKELLKRLKNVRDILN